MIFLENLVGDYIFPTTDMSVNVLNVDYGNNVHHD